MISILYLILILEINFSYAHSGRTDSSGGHRDNNNVSGLGYYHFHHGKGPHLHENGVCPYASSVINKTNQTSNEEKDSNLWMYSIAGIGVIGYVLHSKSKENKARVEREIIQERLRKEIEQRYLDEKEKYTSMYGNRNAIEIAKVPSGILFDKNLKPCSADETDFKWGADYTVFVSKSGSSYHKKKGCSSAEYERHIFDVYNRKSPCKKCVNHEKYSIPSWYFEYKKIMEIKEKYKID